jgi:enoyl-CoA hydratase/carnithine racemase
VPEILTQRNGPVTTLLISNPARMNAMSRDMWMQLAEGIRAADADPAVRVIVLRGEGEKSFVSGADISQFEKMRGSADAQAEYEKAVNDGYNAPVHCSKPVVAAIRGICIGGGLGLAAACDVRICSDDTIFRMPAGRMGLGYGPSGVRRFVAMIGAANTTDLFMSARKFGAAEAQRIGFVSQVHAPDRIDAAVAEYVQMVAENAPLTLAAAKFAIREALKDPADRDTERAVNMVKACFDSQDYREGRTAFMEKRVPQFQGR